MHALAQLLRGRDRKIRRSRSSSAKVSSLLIFQGITRLYVNVREHEHRSLDSQYSPRS